MPLLAPPPLPPPPPPIVESLQQARGTGTVPTTPSTVAFMPGDVEVKLRLGFNGFGLGPLSLLSSLIGWYELQLVGDVGVVHFSDITLGVGGELYYTRPWVLEALTEALFNWVPDGDLSWRAVDRGLAGRFTVHYTGMRALDMYGVALTGPRLFKVDVDLSVDDKLLQGTYSTGGMKFGFGGGVSSVADSGLMGGVELRYLFGWRFKEAAAITLTDASGEEKDLYEMRGAQKPPRGFSWVVFVGYRF